MSWYGSVAMVKMATRVGVVCAVGFAASLYFQQTAAAVVFLVVGVVMVYAVVRAVTDESRARKALVAARPAATPDKPKAAAGCCPYCGAALGKAGGGVRIKLDISQSRPGQQGLFCPECGHEFEPADIQDLKSVVDEPQARSHVPPDAYLLLEVFNAARSEESRKNAVMQFLLDRKLFNPRDQKISYCGCGYPTKLIYADRSWGPICEVVSVRSPHEDDPYTHDYACPKCGAHIQRITM